MCSYTSGYNRSTGDMFQAIVSKINNNTIRVLNILLKL